MCFNLLEHVMVSKFRKDLMIKKKKGGVKNKCYSKYLFFFFFIGITRLERWERAQKHGLNPPDEVKDILLKNKDEEYQMW